MLCSHALLHLKAKKNLLAFSAGVDSTALFFLLLEAKIPFDCAIVNYHTRESSAEEVAYAKELALLYDKQLFIHDAHLTTTAYEHEARTIRYTFFEKVIHEHAYDNLLTAHQLNDQLEWFLMQLTKGAGTLELLGMQDVSLVKEYTLVRPLLQVTKKRLIEYLKEHDHRYFLDQSNEDLAFKRNYFRHTFSDALLEKYATGIKKSLTHIQEDIDLLLDQSSVEQKKELYIIKAPSMRARIYHVDKVFKRLGVLLSSSERENIEIKDSLVISRRFVVEKVDDRIYIAPYCDDVMPKEVKEAFRTRLVPKKLRPYLYKNNISL